MDAFKVIDLTDARRVFVVGDIHGSFTKLEAALSEFNFDEQAGDHLVSVGDLVDRGPENELVVKWIEAPWFHAVRGNHEDMIIDPNLAYLSNKNGGEWFFDLPSAKQKEIRSALKTLPIIMEVLLPGGKRIGICHACYPGPSWSNASELAYDCEQEILWDRRRIRECRLLGFGRTVQDIDHVYYGHTPLNGPFHAGNQSWIDTGAYHEDGYFTIIEVTK
jgi:serine/threonine protein phosphatase 1